MRIILNQNLSHMLESINPSKSEVIKYCEQLYRRYGRIYFEIINESKAQITISAIQQYNPTGNYLTADELRERVFDAFQEFTDKRISVEATPYTS